jgi:hypothetical protein
VAAIDLRAKVLAIVQDKGRSATFHVPSGGGVDKSTGAHTAPTETPTTGLKVSPPFPFSYSKVQSGAVRQGDARVILPAEGLTFAPTIGMRVTMSGTEWRLVDFDPIAQGEDDAAYDLHLRQ